MDLKETPEVMGKFGAVFGIKGWLKVFSFTENPENLFTYKPWFYRHQGGEWRHIEIEDFKRHSDAYIVKIKNIDVREVAQGYTGAEIGILGSSLPELPEGVFRWRDLIGLSVINQDGYDMGKVKNLMETGSNDVLVVKAKINDAYNMKERLIPYIPSVVMDVNLEEKVMRVEWDADF